MSIQDAIPEEGDSEVDEEEVLPQPTTKNTKAQAAKEERKTLAKAETQQVERIRVVTTLVLILTATVVTLGVYFAARKSQKDTFESEYDANANKIISSFHKYMAQFLASMDSFSSAITAHAIDSGSTFPNVTVPHFHILGASTRVLSLSSFVVYMPVVTEEERDGWEAYANASKSYLEPTFLEESTLKHYQDIKYGYGQARRDLQQGVYPYEITGSEGVEANNTGPYYPIWQISPTLPQLSNLNYNHRDLAHIHGPLDQTMERGEASLGTLDYLYNDDVSGEAAQRTFDFLLAMGQFRHQTEDFEQEPVVILAYPVFNNFSIPDRQISGILISAIYWRLWLADTLPPGENGYMAVIENSFKQQNSYRVDGPSVTYLGYEDHHDREYEDMAVEANFADYISATAGPDTASFTAVDLNSDYTDYKLTVYPTIDLEDDLVNLQPLWYALGVACIFAFTAVTFLFYNRLVEQRQLVVLDKAAKSTAVVKSLFPEQVQDRLYEDTEEVTADQTHQGSSSKNDSATQQRLNRFLSKPGPHGPETTKSKPIADNFPECTVVFADLAGFTQWSSNRTPGEVFGLLESLYGLFDAIASQRKVFKVETIGDCYVAITGCPQAQADHAVTMVKFANSCVSKLNVLLGTLADDYGEDTHELSLRIGLHSGPVTGGVLRGERSRFQLFGDTVNTAARMESTGIPGRIHCSQTTADELIVQGKSSWLQPREEKVVAKGKGEMQTYWVQVPKPAVTATSSVGYVSSSTDELSDIRLSERGSSCLRDSAVAA